MRLTIPRKSLLAAVGRIAGIVPSNTPKPVLHNFLFTATDDGLSILASDLEVSCRLKTTDEDIEENGSALVPAKKLQEILGKMTAESVDITTADDRIVISGGLSTFKLPTDDPDLFPAAPDFTTTDYHVFDGPGLKTAIKRTMFATDVESTRYALGGVLLDLNDSPCLVATDGRRLARQFIDASVEGAGIQRSLVIVIPVKALKLIEKNLTDQPVHVSAVAQSAILRIGDTTIVTRLVEGRFPRYQDVFPAESPKAAVEFAASALLKAIEQAAIVTTDDSRGVDFALSTNRLKLTTSVSDSGAATVETSCQYDGEPLDITFDPRYLTEALNTLPGESTVSLALIGPKSPGVLTTDDGYSYVAMPLTRDR